MSDVLMPFEYIDRIFSSMSPLRAGIEETFVYMDFPYAHWQKIRTNNVIERLNREIRRRTRVVGAFRTATPP